MKKDSLIDFLGFIIVRAFSVLLCLQPLRMALWIGRCGGDVVNLVKAKRRSIAYSNLKSAFPEKERYEIRKVVWRHFENIGMNAVELLRLGFGGKRYLERYVRIENITRIKDALSKGKGVILLAAHFGNWEIASLATSLRGYKMSVFAREQKYHRLNNLLNRYREMTGCKVVTKGFSVREIIKTLNNNGIVAMLFDQDAGANGVFVDFLNRPASTAPGVILFALKTGAVILPSFIRRIGYTRHLLEIGEPLELVDTGNKENALKTNLERLTHILEDYIKKFPEQWLWSHKRWKTTPQRTVLVLSDGKTGHLNQAMAVAECVEDALNSLLKARGISQKGIVKIHKVELKYKNALMKVLLNIASFFTWNKCQGCLRCVRFCLKKDSFSDIKNSYADIIISCGAATVGTNIFLTKENNAKNIVIMKPGWGRRRRFNLIILPRHDAPNRLAPNMLITEAAPNRITTNTINEAVLNTPNHANLLTPNSNIGLFIGGDTKAFRLKKDTVRKVVDGILKIAEEEDFSIVVSTSRRTSSEIDAFLKDRLRNNKRCKLLVIANEKNIEGIVPAIFGLSEVIVVSPDSISMVSEGASSGKYTVVFREKGRATKYDLAISSLEAQGYIKIALPDEIYNVVRELLKTRPAIKKLEDRKKIVERLEALV